ncbi:hypothetical protein B7O87_10990 [Cylindrospermopsis raciborskii CENA303]|uniref:Uncharacterized protein n=2 Tax=Cylindrospermopsis raciborskii TaxID=77022 RepID=A0A1X4G5I7_9CYAN|nr:hypothetical protein B7O87_10990 [Cylindrospermopsis raciborskii CENA303]
MENGTSSKIREVLIEEIGHFVDSRINQIDTPGDEGEYFAGLVTDKKLNKDEIDRLKAEDDSNWISVDGERLLIEQSSPGTVTRTPIAPASPGRTRYEVGNYNAFAALKSNGSVVTWGDSSYGGDSSSVASQLTSGVTQIFSTYYAFAALKSDGSVVTWGDSSGGGDSSSVASQLTSGITQIFSNGSAFAALKSNGSVVTWGDSSGGGDSSSVASQLTSGVTQIFSTGFAFAALKSDGSVVTWGSGSGGDSSSVASQLTSGVTQIFSNWFAFAALKSDGSVVTWGSDWSGGDSSSVASQLTSGVTQIFSNGLAFAALKSDGSVVTWGSDWSGGDSSIVTYNYNTGSSSYVSVASQLTSGVTQIFSNWRAFAALKSDGSVVTWGFSDQGGNSSIATYNYNTNSYSYVSVASQLTSGVTQIFSTPYAFAALKSDGSVVTWGDSSYGGDSSSVASQLTSGVTQIFSTGWAVPFKNASNEGISISGEGAFAALKSDGSVVTWGSGSGGDSSSVATQLTSGVTQIFSNGSAFAALKSDGSVVTWGSYNYGGDSSSVASQLTSGVVSFADPFNDDRLVPGSSVTLAVSPSTVAEDGTSNLIYTFTRTGVISNELTVNYTAGGTATNGTDYSNIGTSVTFAANSATATVTVDPTADTTVESDETVSLTLASGTGYTIGTTSAVTGTITNDDNPLNSNVDTPKVNISTGLIFTAQSNGNITLDTNRGSATPDEVTSVQNGTKSNFNHIIGLYEVLNSQGEIKDNQGNTLKPGDANYALHALTTARVKNFAVRAGGNDTPSTATQLGSGVSVLAGKLYAPFAIANGGTYFPGNQGIEDFVAAEQGDINRFSSAPQYVRNLVDIEGKNGDVFNNAPRFVQEPVAYFSFGAANPDGSPHFRSHGNGVYGFEDLPVSYTQYSNNDFNDGVFALTLSI